MKNTPCMYCEEDSRLDSLMVPVTTLSTSKLYLLKDQSFPGRCSLALYEHKTELCDLDTEHLHGFTDDLAQTAAMLVSLFQADKINYAIFGDKMPHLHVHLAVKRSSDNDFGQPYNMCARQPVYLSDGDLATRVETVRQYFLKPSP